MTNLWTVPNWKHLQMTKINSNKKSKLVLGRVENIVEKTENAGYQHFLLFPQCFQKPSHSGSLKVGMVWKRVKKQMYDVGLKEGMGTNTRIFENQPNIQIAKPYWIIRLGGVV